MLPNRRYLTQAMNAAALPFAWRESVYREAERNEVAPAILSNDWLVAKVMQLRRVAFGPLALDSSTDDVRDLAYSRAHECADSIRAEGGDGGARVIVQNAGFEWPGDARSMCARWWKRQLVKALDNRTEEAARALGHVGGRGVSYVCEQTHNRKLQQRARNKRTIDSSVLESDDGEECGLREAVDASTSNPKIRRAELMTRVKGFESIASGLGHVGIFWTWTLPSSFHPIRKDGSRNHRWAGASVRDGADNILHKYAKCRALFAKHGFQVYGLRVMEPHKSGTPHGHMLMFCAPENLTRVKSIVYRVFCSDEQVMIPYTRGYSLRWRVKCEDIKKEKGGAVHYVAKYIAKNLSDEFELNAKTAGASRVLAWASAHRIRQFQFTGGCPVGTWREVRRMVAADVAMSNATLQAAYIVANRQDEDKADFAAFIRLNGGMHCARDKRPIQLEVEPVIRLDAYGSVRIGRLKGVRCGRLVVETRVRNWRVRWGGQARAGEAVQSRTRSNNCNRPLFKAEPGAGLFGAFGLKLGSLGDSFGALSAHDLPLRDPQTCQGLKGVGAIRANLRKRRTFEQLNERLGT